MLKKGEPWGSAFLPICLGFFRGLQSCTYFIKSDNWTLMQTTGKFLGMLYYHSRQCLSIIAYLLECWWLWLYYVADDAHQAITFCINTNCFWGQKTWRPFLLPASSGSMHHVCRLQVTYCTKTGHSFMNKNFFNELNFCPFAQFCILHTQ